jgi:hypothetical protein
LLVAASYEIRFIDGRGAAIIAFSSFARFLREFVRISRNRGFVFSVSLPTEPNTEDKKQRS